MKKIVSLLFLLSLVSSTVLAQSDSFYLRFTGGLGIASFSNKIEVDDDNYFEDVSVGGGTYFSVGVEVERLIVSYINQYYLGTPDKFNGSERDGLGLTINVDSVEAAIKLFDDDLKDLFNFAIGVGRGIGKAHVDFGSSDGYAYLSEFHFKGMGYLTLFESLLVNLEYMSQSFAFVEQDSFSNSLYTLSVTYRY